MSYVQDQTKTATQPQVNVSETTGAGPVSSTGSKATYSYTTRRVPMRSRLEKVGYWILVVAAVGLILLLLGFFLPKIAGAVSTAFFAGLFVTVLTAMNLPRPSAWGNSLLGRKVFPVVVAPERDIMRLAGVNGLLVFIFTVVFQFVADFIGPIFSGLIVFGVIAAAAIFYNRVRSVVIKP